MTRPYSLDLRERVVASVVGGRTIRATVALFGVSVAERGQVVAAAAPDWQQRRQADGWGASGGAARRAGLAAGADRGRDGPDLAPGPGRAGRAGRDGKLRRGVVVLRRCRFPRRVEFAGKPADLP